MGITELEPILEELEASEAGAGGGAGVHPNQLRLPGFENSLPTLLKFSLTIAAIGIAAVAVALIEALAAIFKRWLRRIPWIGGIIGKELQAGVQYLTNAIGGIYNGTDQAIGHSFLKLARIARLLGAVALGSAYVALRVTQLLTKLARKPDLAPRVQKIGQQAKASTVQIIRLQPKISRVTKIVNAPKSHAEAKQIHALQTQVHHLAAEVTQLQKQVKAKPHPSTLKQAAEATALGLAGLGLNSVRCEATRDFDRALCQAGPQGIGRLTRLLGLGLLGLGLVELAKLEGEVIGDVIGPVHEFWRT